MKRRLVVLTLALSTAAAPAADWPQWLGPRRDGSSEEKVVAWTTAPKILWKQNVGEGHSSPVVADGKVYLFTKHPGRDEELLQCFDAVTGQELWKQACDRGPFKGLFGNGPRGTPAVAGGKIYTFGITGVLSCFDAAEGKPLWKIDTLKKYEANNLFFGMSGSPLVEGKVVAVNVGGKKASIVALDKNTGQDVWSVVSDDRASYSSPIAITLSERLLVFLTGKRLVGLTVADGAVLWSFPFQDTINESSTTPVVVGDMLVGSSITLGSVGLKLGAGNVEKKWLEPELTCYFSTPVAIGTDQLYMVTGSLLSKQASLHCVDPATGKKRWTRPKVGAYHASLLRTGDNKLLLLEEDGNLILLDPSPKEYRELARATVCRNTWAHPALANGRLYVRDEKELICLEFSK